MIVVVIVFLVYIGFREWLFYIHVKDLEVKLMSKDPQEYFAYKEIDRQKKEVEEKPADELVDPFEIAPEDALRGLGDTNE